MSNFKQDRALDRAVHKAVFGGTRSSKLVPFYSTAAGAAFQIVEALRPRMCCITIKSDHDFCWTVSMIKAPDYSQSAEAMMKAKHEPCAVVDGEDSLPRAICLAALQALQAGEETWWQGKRFR